MSKVILWDNKFIFISDKSVYFRNLAEKGIFRVGKLPRWERDPSSGLFNLE